MSDDTAPNSPLAPTPEQDRAAASAAADLVASSVADLTVLIDGMDLLTLRHALAAEEAKGDAARKGAVAVLQGAIASHPDNVGEEATPAAAEPVPEEVAPVEPDAVSAGAASPTDGAAPEAAEEPPASPMADEAPVAPELAPEAEAPTAAPAVEAEPVLAVVEEAAATEELPVAPEPADTLTIDTGIVSAIEPLEDEPPTPGAVSAAPPRPHQSLIDQLDLRWNELKDFVGHLEGTVDGELGDVIAFVRTKL